MGDAMSLLDQVRQYEQQVVERLKELEPLIGEYTQLRKLAQRLGVSYTPPEENEAATGAPARRTSAGKKRTPTRRSAAKTRSARTAAAKSAAKRPSRTRAAGSTGARSAGTATTAAKTAATGTPAKASTRRSRGRKAASARPGQRTEDVLRIVGEHPGITVREIGERLGVDATGLYRVANKLTADGRARKDGTRLYAAEPAAGLPDTGLESAPGEDTNAGAQPSPSTSAGGGGNASPGDDASDST